MDVYQSAMKKITQCVVCNRTGFLRLYKTGDRMFDIPGLFGVKKCIGCGLFFLDPQPTKRTLKKHYPHQRYYSYKIKITGLSGLIGRFRAYLIRHYYEPTILSKLFSILVQGIPAIPRKPDNKFARVLDVGCGSGVTLILLQELGWKVYGLEIDKNAVKIARARGLGNVKIGGYERIADFPNNYFDCIRMYHVIEHLPEPYRCLQIIYKKLRPGGEIVLGTPNADSLISRLFGKLWYNLDIPRHLFVFSPKTLSKIVTRAGFSYTIVSYCSADGLGRSIIYTLNDVFNLKMDTNKFTLLFFVLYPIEWILDKLRIGDIIILRGVK